MHKTGPRWMLPAGFEEMLPAEARQLETLRRAVLDRFNVWGYDLVVPPLAEFLDSLLVGAGEELDLQTFRLTDQLTGRPLGLRADITPQVARIDAHRLQQSAADGATVRRLCYAGHVLRCRADEWSGARNPLQTGAELFGIDSPRADLESIRLMIETLETCGLKVFSIDLGHVGVFRSLAQDAHLDDVTEHELFDIMQRKARPELEAFLAEASLPAPVAEWLRALPSMHGGIEVLDRADAMRATVQTSSPELSAALDRIRDVATALRHSHPHVDLHLDLAELRGYAYHTGLVFAAFVPGSGQAIARGGRYDGIGAAFGTARPATGFSTDLMSLLRCTPSPQAEVGPLPVWVRSDAAADPRLATLVANLRESGRRVVEDLGTDAAGDSARARIVHESGRWILREADD